MIQLGAKVRSKITGFTGIVTGRTEYISGCVQLCVTPRAKDGKSLDSVWIDDDQLTVLKGGLSAKSKKAGGPQDNTPPARYQG